MAITNSKQSWVVGNTVKIGFLSLEIVAIIPTPGDYRPDQYELKSSKGVRYTFTPHFGLERIS